MNTETREREARDTREPSPAAGEVLAARMAAGLSQEKAAQLVGLSSFTRWSEYERGIRNMESSRFELFQIKTGQHKEFGPLRRVVPTPARK